MTDAPGPRLTLAEREQWLRDHGATLCSRGKPLTEADLDTAEWFMAWLKAPGKVPYPGCPRCARVTSIDPEPGQVVSCGEHSYVKRGEEPPHDHPGDRGHPGAGLPG